MQTDRQVVAAFELNHFEAEATETYIQLSCLPYISKFACLREEEILRTPSPDEVLLLKPCTKASCKLQKSTNKPKYLSPSEHYKVPLFPDHVGVCVLHMKSANCGESAHGANCPYRLDCVVFRSSKGETRYYQRIRAWLFDDNVRQFVPLI